MFSAARPALAGAIRELKDPSTSWSSLSLAAIALACSSAIRLRVASMVTRRSPCFTRKSEIISAGDDSAATDPQKRKTIESRMVKCGFMYFRARGTNKLGSKYHSFPHYANARKERESAGAAHQTPSRDHRIPSAPIRVTMRARIVQPMSVVGGKADFALIRPDSRFLRPKADVNVSFLNSRLGGAKFAYIGHVRLVRFRIPDRDASESEV